MTDSARDVAIIVLAAAIVFFHEAIRSRAGHPAPSAAYGITKRMNVEEKDRDPASAMRARLEPIENEIHEAVDLLFTSRAKDSMADSEGKITLDFNDPDSAEPIREGIVDLAAIATEFFLLGIDPYPRKEGAVFDAPKTPEDPSKHPFAALAALKKAGGRDKK